MVFLCNNPNHPKSHALKPRNERDIQTNVKTIIYPAKKILFIPLHTNTQFRVSHHIEGLITKGLCSLQLHSHKTGHKMSTMMAQWVIKQGQCNKGDVQCKERLAIMHQNANK